MNDISVIHTMGGMQEFEKTGIYPDYLIIHSPKLKRTWRIKVRNEIQEGNLKRNGIIIFNYKLDGYSFKLQQISENGELGKWQNINLGITMFD